MKKQIRFLTLALFLALFFCTAVFTAVNGQSKVKFTEPKKAQADATLQEEKPYKYVNQMPEFAGGEAALRKFLIATLQYPAKGAAGITYASFIVEKDGSVTDIEILKSADSSLDKEVIRVLKLTSGKWKPGKQNGKLVRVQFTQPIEFNASK